MRPIFIAKCISLLGKQVVLIGIIPNGGLDFELSLKRNITVLGECVVSHLIVCQKSKSDNERNGQTSVVNLILLYFIEMVAMWLICLQLNPGILGKSAVGAMFSHMTQISGPE